MSLALVTTTLNMTSRFVLERTKEPRRSGLGAYLKALRKYDIEPTKHIQATEENKIVFKDRAKSMI